MLYLDYAASTPIRPGALKVLETSMREDFVNPSSAHKLGKGLQRRIEDCRETFLGFLGAVGNDRLIFNSSATEANNTVIAGIDLKANDTVIMSSADHPSVTGPVDQLKKKGVRVKELPLQTNGCQDEEGFLQLLDGSVKLVILTHVNNQSGTIIDVCRLSRQIKTANPDVHIHVDAAQSFGKIPFSLKEGNINSLCIASHKIGGPKGIAGLYLHAKTQLLPLLYGGGQENGLRASTQAAPLIFSFHEAAREAVETIEASMAHVTKLNQLARRHLTGKLEILRFPFSSAVSPYILTFILPGISSDIILRHLEQKGIMISSSSACSSKLKGDNPVFTALHIPLNDHKFVLRASFSHETTEEDIIRFCDTLAAIYDDLKRYIK